MTPQRTTKTMTKQAQIFYAKKFYPHLREMCGVECIRASLKANGIAFEQ